MRVSLDCLFYSLFMLLICLDISFSENATSTCTTSKQFSADDNKSVSSSGVCSTTTQILPFKYHPLKIAAVAKMAIHMLKAALLLTMTFQDVCLVYVPLTNVVE